MKKRKKIKFTGKFLTHFILIILSLSCILPLIMIISNSLVSESTFDTYGFTVLPKEFCLDAYKYVFRNPDDIIESYKVTVFITVVGTVLGMLLMHSFAYALSRTEYKYRNFLSFYIYFTMLFGGGMVAKYIWMTRYLRLYNNIWVLILPALMSPFYIIILRGCCKDVPSSLIENARVEGANEFQIFFGIIVPLTKAGIATIALFTVFHYWSQWFPSMLYMDSGRNTTIQYHLTKVLQSAEFSENASETMGGIINTEEPATEAVRMAICIIAVGPAMVIFPFFQKYFAKGVTVGSVKG